MCDERIESIPLTVGAEPGSEGSDKTFASYEEYRYEAIYVGHQKYRIIEVPGHPGTELAIPLEPSERIDVDETLAALRALPEPGLVRRLLLIDDAHPDQQWYRQLRNASGLTIDGELGAAGEIRLYRPALGADLRSALLAQWCRLLRFAVPAAASAYDSIGEIEPFELQNVFAPEALQSDLSWSMLGAYLAEAPRDAGVLVDAVALPIRSSIFGAALGERLRLLAPERRGSAYETHALMANWLAKIVTPKALEALAPLRGAGDSELRKRTEEIIRLLETQTGS